METLLRITLSRFLLLNSTSIFDISLQRGWSDIVIIDKGGVADGTSRYAPQNMISNNMCHHSCNLSAMSRISKRGQIWKVFSLADMIAKSGSSVGK